MSQELEANPLHYINDAVDTNIHRVERLRERYEQLIARTKEIPAVSIAVVWPCEAHALEGPVDAANEQRSLLEKIKSIVTAAGGLNDDGQRRLQEIARLFDTESQLVSAGKTKSSATDKATAK